MNQETTENTYESLAQATGQKAADLAERRETRGHHNAKPRLGATYTFHQTAGQDLEWAIVERRPDDGNLLVVPLDAFPFVGSRDIELPESALGGVAHARCDVGVWLEPSTFRSEQRTGFLPAEDLERIRERRRDALQNRLQPSLLEDDADADPQYQLWREATLRPAAARLETAPSKAKLLSFPRIARWAVPLATAASLLLATRLAMTVQEMERLEKTLQSEQQRFEQRLEEVSTSKNELEERLTEAEIATRQGREASAAELEELRSTMSQELAERETRIAELSNVFREEPHLPPHYRLESWDRDRSSRGEATLLRIGQDGRLFVLDLEVEDPEPYLHYRLQIAMKGTDGVTWQTDDLKKQGRWLSLVLPSGLFESDTQYEIRLAGLEEGEAVDLDERYLVMIQR